MNKKVIPVDGARIDTLWTTIESGTDENGNDYEKKQAVAPRTHEKAITDDNGTVLSVKLEDILNRIAHLGGGGEYDTLLAEIEKIKTEIADLDLEKWNYNVPEAKKLSFAGYNNPFIAVDPDTGVFTIDRGGKIINIPPDGGRVQIERTLYAQNVILPLGAGLYIGQATNKSCYIYYADPQKNLHLLGIDDSETTFQLFSVLNKQFYFYSKANFHNGQISIGGQNLTHSPRHRSISTAKIAVSLSEYDSETKNFNGGIQFNDSESNTSWIHVIAESPSTAQLSFYVGRYSSGFEKYAYVGTDGRFAFLKDIVAPNIASRAAVLSAQQEITEMDLQNIEAQRTITEQELNNIEVQQELTEINLLLLEKESA